MHTEDEEDLDPHGECATEIANLRKALRLAVNLLSIYEPPDSRACSDDFVALAAVDCKDTSEPVMAVIEAGLKRQAESGANADVR